jgi:hypothetical protein
MVPEHQWGRHRLLHEGSNPAANDGSIRKSALAGSFGLGGPGSRWLPCASGDLNAARGVADDCGMSRQSG